MSQSATRAIRAKCLDCSENFKSVAYCPAFECALWPWRFGCGPKSAAHRHGAHVTDPKRMPGGDVDLDELPTSPRDYEPGDPT